MKNIIVVDDDPMAGKILVRMLRSEYRAHAFVDPAQALAHFMEHGADIVITDLKMPEMDGMELLARIKEINADAIVFIITGFASVDGAVRAIKMGAHDYLAKPFNPDDVLVKLTRAIREQSLEKQCSSYRQRMIGPPAASISSAVMSRCLRSWPWRARPPAPTPTS